MALESRRIDLFTQGTDLSFWHTFYGAGASSASGQQPFYCGSHGAQCCASTVPGAHTGCIDPNEDACDPGTNSCTSCGLGDGQMCCPMVGYTHHQCKNGWACDAQSDRCEGPAECGHAGHVCCNDGCHDGSTCVGRTDDLLGVRVAPQGTVCAGAGAACGGAQGCCNGLS